MFYCSTSCRGELNEKLCLICSRDFEKNVAYYPNLKFVLCYTKLPFP